MIEPDELEKCLKSNTYKKSGCCGDSDCILLGVNDDQPCYGQVSAMEEYDGTNHWWVHICEGHWDYSYVKEKDLLLSKGGFNNLNNNDGYKINMKVIK